MIILINGAFGAGKSTAAEHLRAALPHSAVYDPEIFGSILMRLPAWVRLRGSGTDDFQDIDAWRKSVIAGTRVTHMLRSRVIVPMTFTNRSYFDEVVAGLHAIDHNTHVVCLRATLDTVKQRLQKRGTPTTGPQSTWIMRRIAECDVAHRDSHFGHPIYTDNRSVADVTLEIVEYLKQHHE